MINRDRIQEMAALHALGALDPEDASQFRDLLRSRHPQAVSEAAACTEISDLMAVTLCEPRQPSPRLRHNILEQARALIRRDEISDRIHQLSPPSMDGFTFMRGTTTNEGWIDLPVPGARVKILSVDSAIDNVTALARLEPGAHYPMHKHRGSEQIYLIEGDLHIGNQELRTGDFHRAEAGTTHGVIHTDAGCTLLVMVTLSDLISQFIA